MRKLVLAGFMVIGVLGITHGAEAQVSISSCGTLSQANTTYKLTQNVSSDGTCFSIQASGVTLDLNGFTATYDNLPNIAVPNYIVSSLVLVLRQAIGTGPMGRVRCV